MEHSYHIALAGNPNVGKSTVFNNLTGLHQHTGNWPGKTVENKTGTFRYNGTEYRITDIPGTYSLNTRSPEEAIAGEFLCSGTADCIVLVCDGGCLERNLLFVLQVLSRVGNCVVCVNLMDEAEKRGVRVDGERFSEMLGCPVVLCAAGVGRGMEALTETIAQAVRSPDKLPRAFPEYGSTFAEQARTIASSCIHTEGRPDARDRRLDRIFTGRITAYPVMAALVLLVFWLTVSGAGYLSAWLETGLGLLVSVTRNFTVGILGEGWAVSLLWDGIFATVCQVTAVMLPPMAVFFPLFTLLEDSGYLPRAAFNLDRLFRRCGSCGKQALTMLMGFGCNAVGVTGCRIIDSPRERLIAMLTNAFVPCNGRFPALILLIGLMGMGHNPLLSAGVLTGFVLLGVVSTLGATAVLGKTLLRGKASFFTLELPPYRPPRVGQVILRSVWDRTLHVLGRAAAVAAPAGLVIWGLANIRIGDISLLHHAAEWLDPVGRVMGMDGVILLAFVLGLPANEVVLPLAVMLYTAADTLSAGADMGAVLTAAGWTPVTALCVAVFTLFHWPCSTTLLTLRKETGSVGWTAVAAVMPTLWGAVLCMGIAAVARWVT